MRWRGSIGVNLSRMARECTYGKPIKPTDPAETLTMGLSDVFRQSCTKPFDEIHRRTHSIFLQDQSLPNTICVVAALADVSIIDDTLLVSEQMTLLEILP